MEEVDNLAFEAINRYFTILGYKGYVKDNDVYNLIFLLFIRRLLHNFQMYITEDDYRKFDSILQCMFGYSCLVPYYTYVKQVPIVIPYTKMQYVMDEHNQPAPES